MAMIPSERFVFADMSVTDNLLLGGANDPDADRRAKRLELVHELFPILRRPRRRSSPGRCRAASSGWSASAWP